ncbi:MAG: Ni/Fe-hydrogenase, b-type cytochrome subunit [Acidobacteria bacterium]|nr:Ni/Fe-hydrogenase, b-type cytochrome subunit [Acidobacteriota bacterium]
MKTRSNGTSRIFSMRIWELPVRLTHWIMTICVAVTGVTGYLIGTPLFSQPGEASSLYSFGTLRFVHFLAGYVLLSAFLLRVYWGFIGNKYARWSSMLPLHRKSWQAIGEEFLYLLRPRGPMPVYRGHAPLAGVSYFVLYLGLAFALLSGFTLYAQAGYSPVWRTFGALALALFGNHLNTVRLLHHLTLWFFTLFLIIHLYLVIYTDLFSRTNEVDAMISGRKFAVRDELSPFSD